MWISVKSMFIYNPPHKIKNPIILHIIIPLLSLFALFILGRTKVIEAIVTVLYKQCHMVLGFQHT